MFIRVSVKPNSREDGIERVSEEEYKVSVKAPAEHGKANVAVIKILAKHFSVSQGSVIIKGWTARKKLVEIVSKTEH